MVVSVRALAFNSGNHFRRNNNLKQYGDVRVELISKGSCRNDGGGSGTTQLGPTATIYKDFVCLLSLVQHDVNIQLMMRLSIGVSTYFIHQSINYPISD